MPVRLNRIPSKLAEMHSTIHSLREQIITNSILIGQTPTEMVIDDEPSELGINLRVRTLIERFSELGLQETTSDPAGNAIALINGSRKSDSCIIVAAHIDTVYQFEQEANITVDDNYITGPGIIDNSISLGVMLSLPDILNTLGIQFQSDILLLGLQYSLAEQNLSSIRSFLDSWKRPIQYGIILEGVELGRLNYFSRSMMRLNIVCEIPSISGWENKFGSNAIIVLNEIINRILEIHLPQRPHTQIIIGKFRGGIKHGDLALSASMGLEIESVSDIMVQKVYSQIEEIVDNVQHEYRVDIRSEFVSNVNAARLEHRHPLVRTGVNSIKALGIQPMIESSESELSIFLDHGIPAITIGLSHGKNQHTETASIEIESLMIGITQLVDILQNLDAMEEESGNAG